MAVISLANIRMQEDAYRKYHAEEMERQDKDRDRRFRIANLKRELRKKKFTYSTS